LVEVDMRATPCSSRPELADVLRPSSKHVRSVRDLLGHELFARQNGLGADEKAALTYERMRLVGKWAAPGTSVLADQERYVTLMEHVALVDPALFLSLGVHLGVCLGTLRNLGASADVSATVAALDEMDAVAVILTTELGHGTSQSTNRTVARFDTERRDFVLHTPDAGAQKFMANVAAPGVAKIGIVFATVTCGDRVHGLFPFVVPLRDAAGPHPGVHIVALGDAGATQLDHSLVSFESVRVPYGAWLRGEARFDATGEFHDPLGNSAQRAVQSVAGVENMWLGLSAGAAAATRGSVAVLARYARQRVTAAGLASWTPVLRYRNLQASVFGALASSYAITFLVNRSLRQHEALRATGPAGSRPTGDVTWAPWSALNSDLALTKVCATTVLGRVAARCRERARGPGHPRSQPGLRLRGARPCRPLHRR
jgi:acyl-CoA oxidase